MPNKQLVNITITDKDGRCFVNGRMADEWNVIHKPKIMLRFCYQAEKPEQTAEQLKRLNEIKTAKSCVSVYIGKIAFRDLIITGCDYSNDTVDDKGNAVPNCVMVQAEAGRATTKADLDEVYP